VDATHERVVQDRVYQIDATAVRIMKVRRWRGAEEEWRVVPTPPFPPSLRWGRRASPSRTSSSSRRSSPSCASLPRCVLCPCYCHCVWGHEDMLLLLLQPPDIKGAHRVPPGARVPGARRGGQQHLPLRRLRGPRGGGGM